MAGCTVQLGSFHAGRLLHTSNNIVGGVHNSVTSTSMLGPKISQKTYWFIKVKLLLTSLIVTGRELRSRQYVFCVPLCQCHRVNFWNIHRNFIWCPYFLEKINWLVYLGFTSLPFWKTSPGNFGVTPLSPTWEILHMLNKSSELLEHSELLIVCFWGHCTLKAEAMCHSWLSSWAASQRIQYSIRTIISKAD